MAKGVMHALDEVLAPLNLSVLTLKAQDATLKMSTELHRRYSLNGETMGSRYTTLFYAEPDLSTEDIHHSLARAVSRVDQQMSTWKADSDLNRLNAAPEQQWVSMPKELVTCCPRRCGS